MYRETYYVVGNRFESEEDFLETVIGGRFRTIERAKDEIKDLNRYYGGHKNQYEIAKVTVTIEKINSKKIKKRGWQIKKNSI